MRRTVEWSVVADVVIAATLVLAWVTSREFPGKSRLFPTLVIAASGVILMVAVVARFRRKPTQNDGKAGRMDLRPDDELTPSEALRRAAPQFGWLIGVVAAATVFGPMLVLPVFLFAHVRLSGRQSLAVALALSVGFAAFEVGVFEVLLNLSWPIGLLPGPQDAVLDAITWLVDRN